MKERGYNRAAVLVVNEMSILRTLITSGSSTSPEFAFRLTDKRVLMGVLCYQLTTNQFRSIVSQLLILVHY